MQEEFNEALAEEFMEDFHDSQDDIRGTLIELEKNPNNIEAAQALFRSVHSIKGNLQMIGLGRVSDLIHRLEDLLDAVRKNQMKFTPLFSDLILLNIETVHDICVEIFDYKDVSKQLDSLLFKMKNLSTEKHDDIMLVDGIKIFDPEYKTATPDVPKTNPTNTNYVERDLVFFNDLAQTMEHRVVGELGKTQRICKMALQMNKIADKPVDEIQLRAAALTHDIGMAFLPLSLLNKTEKYSELERQKLLEHPSHASTLLQGLGNWEAASTIVKQHHERVDGRGYPGNLNKTQITEGAKILAIADTFESMSHSRADREHRRTAIRIVAEINNNRGTQFDEYWVNIFNDYVRERYSKAK